MCVLTYLPVRHNGFIFTSNRDEHLSRKPAIPPAKYLLTGSEVLYPKDPHGGGTWIGGSYIHTLCLLNGGLEPHISQPPYRQSRGMVIPDFYQYNDAQRFISAYDFGNMEPFTLIIVSATDVENYHEVRWTGLEVISRTHPRQVPAIWSSVTLYSPEVIQERENWFADFLEQHPDYTPDDVLRFHHTGGSGDSTNDLKMNRDNLLKTLSITQFVVSADEHLLIYDDLQENKRYTNQLFK